MADIWAELGIAPTTDRGLVRRAYATRLKTVSPESDPHGFTRLREAYERALRAADAGPARTEPAPAHAPAASPATPRPAPPSPPPDRLGEALRRQDVLAAAEWLLAARPDLALADDIRLTDRLGWVMAQDRTLSAEAVRAAAEHLGWDQHGVPGAWAKVLRARLDAEQWLGTLRQQAASGKRFLGAARCVAARALLGRGRMRLLRTMANDRTLRQRYGEYLLHAGVIEDQFDPARIAAVREVLTAKPEKPKGVLSLLLGILIIAGVFGYLAGEIDPQARDGTVGIVAVGLVLTLFGSGWRRRIRAARQRAKPGRPPRAVRLAFWVSLAVTGTVLATIAMSGLLVGMVQDAPGTGTPPLLVDIESLGGLLAVTGFICLPLSRRLMRRGRHGFAFVAAIGPLALLLLGSLALGFAPAP